MKKTKVSKGITLVALIITIVILLILAMTTIGSMKDSKIIGYAQSAKDSYTIGQEKEQIGLAVSEWQVQKVVPGNTKTFHEVVDEALNDTADVIDNHNGTLTVTFSKTTRNVYIVDEKGNITKQNADKDNGNEDEKDDTITGDFEIVVTQTSNGFPLSSVTLTMKPIIPESWKHVYTTEEGDLAAKDVARYLGVKNSDGTESTTLEQAIIAIINKEAGLPQKFSKDQYNELVAVMSSEIEADISTPEKFVVVLMSQMGNSFTTIQDCATYIGYIPTFYKVQIRRDSEEWIDITDEVSLSNISLEVKENGTYEIQIQLDDKKSTSTIKVTEFILGKYVKYDANGNGSVEDETLLWRVLRNDADKVELITADVLGNFDIDREKDFDTRIYKYNNAIDFMVAECKRVTGITKNIRSVGGPAIDTTTETVVFRNLNYFEPKDGVDFSQYEATEQNPENGLKIKDNNEREDVYQMRKAGILKADNELTYWLSSRDIFEFENGVDFGIKYSYCISNGAAATNNLSIFRISSSGIGNDYRKQIE